MEKFGVPMGEGWHFLVKFRRWATGIQDTARCCSWCHPNLHRPGPLERRGQRTGILCTLMPFPNIKLSSYRILSVSRLVKAKIGIYCIKTLAISITITERHLRFRANHVYMIFNQSTAFHNFWNIYRISKSNFSFRMHKSSAHSIHFYASYTPIFVCMAKVT